MAEQDIQIPWKRVERAIDKAKEQLEGARTEEEFQAIGLLCREAMISLAQVVFDPQLHMAADGVTPSETDAKRKLDAYLMHELRGSSHEAARKFAIAAVDLTNHLQHKRTATFRDAALCVEATAAVVSVVALISGHLYSQGQEMPAISQWHLFLRTHEEMPALLNEMREGLLSDPYVREFFVLSSRQLSLARTKQTRWIYYDEDHPNLLDKSHILEERGFVRAVTTVGSAPIFRMTDDFAQCLLHPVTQ
jgi:hypothetical protein